MSSNLKNAVLHIVAYSSYMWLCLMCITYSYIINVCTCTYNHFDTLCQRIINLIPLLYHLSPSAWEDQSSNQVAYTVHRLDVLTLVNKFVLLKYHIMGDFWNFIFKFFEEHHSYKIKLCITHNASK